MKHTPKSHPIADKTVIDKAIQFASELPKPRKPAFKRLLGVIGPGVITGFADDDESGIGTYSQTGAQYGFKLLWTVLFMLPMMYVVQEMAGRIGVVTGEGIAKNITNNKKIMGTHTNGWLTNTLGMVTFVVMGFSATFALYSFFHP